MNSVTSQDILFCIILCILLALWKYNTKGIPKGYRLPPGPPRKPIVGNMTDMSHDLMEAATRWAQEYGDLVYIELLGTSMVFVNSLEIARDLFEKRSSLYSDRNDFPMLMLSGWHFNVGLLHYGHWWRRHRKKFHQYFHPAATVTYQPVQTRFARAMLPKFRDSPEDYRGHIKHFSGGVIMEIIYDIKILPQGDPYIATADKAIQGAGDAMVPGAYLIEILPILKHVPAWMPGAGFKRQAEIWRKSTFDMFDVPFRVVKDALASDSETPCVLTSMLKELSNEKNVPEREELVIQNVAAVSYAGGAGTLVGALLSFMLAMLLHPEVQRKAQAELDAVIGSDRFPEFDDRDNLPYVNALCEEIQRWRPVTPFAVPHRLMDDDIYGDYFIPKGTIVMGNARLMLHDEKMYGPRPEEFDPDRFFKDGVRVPSAQYGFGRRICPGRYFANNTIFIMAASILHVFQISKAIDENGNEVPAKEEYSTGGFAEPLPFPCSIKPRSKSAEKLINEVGTTI
ncbi:cytochrome P450 [Ramaria rubella]|nr:cytochrome P450 [Ramaria rubella]